MVPPLILSSDSHVFEPPDLWTTRIDAAFRDRAPRMQRIDGADQLVVEADQVISGIGLISNAGARFEAPETISRRGASRTCIGAATTPTSTSPTCGSTGWRARYCTPRRACSTSGWPTPRSCPRSSARTTTGSPTSAAGTHPAQGHRDDHPGRRPRRHQGAGAGGPPGPRRRHDQRVSARGPALRPARVRAVLGGRPGARHAAEPAHGHPTAGQDPRGRRQDTARREQPGDEGVLSGALDVRHDLLGCLRAPSRPHGGHRGVRARVGAARALHHGLHVSRAPRRGDLPIQGRLRPSDFFRRTSCSASRRTPSAFACGT